MDIPDLVEGALEGEEIQAGVSLGDEDAVCLTPTRTLIYRGEGLLSDEQVEEYSHDVEQLAVSEGRRKTKFTMQYIDGTDSFTVPANRGEKVLELFLEGVLRREGVIEARESLAGVYRFSELTLIIAEQRLIKHIGSQVWSEDYEMYPYESVTGLDFERASVATSIALSVDGRPQRIKVPNDEAPVVRQTLEGALFDFYGVGSIEELNRAVGTDDEAPAAEGVEDQPDPDDGDGFAFGDDFDPLVSDEDDPLSEPVGDDQLASESGTAGSTDPDPDRAQREDQPSGGSPQGAPSQGDPSRGGQSQSGSATADDRRPDGRSEGSDESQSADAARQPDRSADRSDRSGDESGHSGDASAGTGQSDASAGTQQSDPSQPQESAGSASPQSQSADTAPAEPRTDTTQSTGSGPTESPTETAATDSASAGHAQSSGSPSDDPLETETAGAGAAETDAPASSTAGEPADSTTEPSETEANTADAEGAPVTRAEYEAMAERLDELTDAVDRQNELLKRQHRALKRLAKQHEQTE